MATSKSKQISLTKSISAYKKSNPNVVKALDTYAKSKSYAYKNVKTGKYKTTTSTKMSSIFTSR